MKDDHDHIDLGVSPKEMYSDNSPMSMPEKMDKDTIYPVLRYSGPTELHLPEEGKMEVHFTKTSETSSIRKDGSHWYECCIEIHCLGEVESDEPESPTSRHNDAEAALDRIAAEVSKARGNGNDEDDEEEQSGNPGY